MEALIVIVVVGVIIAVAIAGAMQARKRREAMQQWAQRQNWRFDPGKDHQFGQRHRAFGALQRGSRRYAYNIITGRCNDRPLVAFDYHYETYSTDSKGRRQTHHHYFSGVILDSGLPLKSLHIRPEGFFDKVAAFFGVDDINFESAEFSRTFHVKSPDRQWAYDVIHQATMEFMLAMPRYSVEFEGQLVMVYHGSRTLSIEQFEQAMRLAQGILDRFPAYLLQDLKGALT